MRRAMKPLVMLGIGAAVYSFNQNKSASTKKDWLHSIQGMNLDRLLSKKHWRKASKRLKKTFK